MRLFNYMEKTILKACKFRLMPTKEQKLLLEKHFGCARFVFNYFLNQRKERYALTGKSDFYHAQALALTQLKKQNEFSWLKEVNSQSLQEALANLDIAFCSFFKGKTSFPRFKSRKNNVNSFTVPQFLSLKKNRLFIPKFKQGIKLNLHQSVKGKIKRCTISKTASGKYFVSILCEVQHVPFAKTGKSVGIDLGLKDFAILSNGTKFKNHKFTKKYERALKKAQQHLSHKVKGSHSFEKQRRKVALLHEKISNSRKDVLHKVSHRLVKDFDIICIESLNVKGMIKNHKLAKHIADASWGTFVQMLEYKAQWNDKQIVKVGRFFPSSKTCNSCGWINQSLNLSMREWDCPSCKKHLDRDINASINTLNEGLKSLGTSDNTDGDSNKTKSLNFKGWHKSLKSEAHSSLVSG